jgi:quinoprotein glucose dehydrogenase
MPGFGFSGNVLSDRAMKALLAYITDPAADSGPLPPAQGGHGGSAGPYPNGEAHRYIASSYSAVWYTKAGLPASPPPWSELVAYDLNEGTIKWRIPLGTVPQLAAKGIKNTGSLRPTRNGPVVTAGGLIFVGTAGDQMIRAYDKDTGNTLWERRMESRPESIPAVYEVGGRQYVAFFLKSGQAQGYYVFALPKPASTPKK